mmetsp:Transcript_8116/g.16868  ORF Transcript_8116/g.16868 Transcript_8116/m.16868 type:complete len:441 (+) Transcript_8116:1920-3242(+)
MVGIRVGTDRKFVYPGVHRRSGFVPVIVSAVPIVRVLLPRRLPLPSVIQEDLLPLRNLLGGHYIERQLGRIVVFDPLQKLRQIELLPTTAGGAVPPPKFGVRPSLPAVVDQHGGGGGTEQPPGLAVAETVIEQQLLLVAGGGSGRRPGGEGHVKKLPEEVHQRHWGDDGARRKGPGGKGAPSRLRDGADSFPDIVQAFSVFLEPLQSPVVERGPGAAHLRNSHGLCEIVREQFLQGRRVVPLGHDVAPERRHDIDERVLIHSGSVVVLHSHQGRCQRVHFLVRTLRGCVYVARHGTERHGTEQFLSCAYLPFGPARQVVVGGEASRAVVGGAVEQRGDRDASRYKVEKRRMKIGHGPHPGRVHVHAHGLRIPSGCHRAVRVRADHVERVAFLLRALVVRDDHRVDHGHADRRLSENIAGVVIDTGEDPPARIGILDGRRS